MEELEYKLKQLSSEVTDAKKCLKRWEAVFTKKHERPPKIQDISDRPSIKRQYKHYNKLKKDLEHLKKTIAKAKSDTVLSPPDERDRSLMRLPNGKAPNQRVQEFIRRDSGVQKATMADIEELKAVLEGGNQIFTQDGMTEDEFWLSDSRPYASQPLPSTSSSATSLTASPTNAPVAANTQPKRLILGGPPPPVRKIPQRFHPFLRRHRINENSKRLMRENSAPSLTPMLTKPKVTRRSSDPITREAIQFEEEGDDVIQIENHEVDPFHNYDPSLFRWDDPNFSIGPCFFTSDKVYASFGVPFLNDAERRLRVMKKLENGTLGEPTPENFKMEEDIPDDIREFIEKNTTTEPAHPISRQNSAYGSQRRRKIKRQTKLVKLKFVEV